ncbi:MAG TPA: PA2779 family protein [Burkholderiales bacterium]|nr:PA2779 family protein [Burkholderiales bacterium]
MDGFHRWISRLLIVCMSISGFPLSAFAGIVVTDQISVATERDRIRSFLDRAEVRARIGELGVDANKARARVDALTDDEARELAARIDGLPAGGDSVLGVLLVVFLVLLITDILGLTKVFSFTKSIR